MIRVFISYSHVDDNYRNELQKHLTGLQYQGTVETWHDRRINAGEEWANCINNELQRADIILLLVSSDFIASRYCYELEMTAALNRHHCGEAVVIPVILRPCHWTGLPFGKLQAATKDGKPVEKYLSLDDAFLEITQNIEIVARRLALQSKGTTAVSSMASALSERLTINQNPPRTEFPRSSNLVIPKTFSDHDRDMFVADAFNYIANYFEGSLDELQARNPEMTKTFQKVDARSFEAVIYRHGSQVSKCGIWLGSSLGFSRGPAAIVFSFSGLGQQNSFNESLSVNDNGNMLGLEPMGMSHFLRTEKKPLTNEGAGE